MTKKMNQPKPQINIYGDESCHLEHDGQKAMVLGAISCEKNALTRIKKEIWTLKKKYSLAKTCELKWTKVSPSKVNFYVELINYFFGEASLNFRALIIPDKEKLDHQSFEQTHDQWYYKMYFESLKVLFDREHNYEIFLDLKDTLGNKKLPVMKKILSAGSKNSGIKKIQLVRSDEAILVQLTDILIGALSYQARQLHSSLAKEKLLTVIRGHLGYPLTTSSPFQEKKFNYLIWKAQVK